MNETERSHSERDSNLIIGFFLTKLLGVFRVFPKMGQLGWKTGVEVSELPEMKHT